MQIPGETLISTAIEQIVAGVQIKVSQIEESRNREFAHQMKELEFYKSSYERELRDIFDFWFEVVFVTQIKDNQHITPQEREKHQRRYMQLVNVNTMAKYQIATLKYGGKETCRILALYKQLQQDEYKDQPEFVNLYMICRILAVIKYDILGQDISPMDILKVLTNDFDKNKRKVDDAQEYVDKVYHKVYPK